MKVKTLIERLKRFNPEAEVRLNHYCGETLLFISARANDDNVVYLEGENEVNMKEEIGSRFKYGRNINDYDFYRQMLEDGITVDMVDKYMDKEHADNMYNYCVENDLL